MPDVRFVYSSGLLRSRFANALLRGSWDALGRAGGAWSERPMAEATCEDGCPGFEATVSFPATEVGKRFEWDVLGDGPWGRRCLVATEEDDSLSRRTVRSFTLREGGQVERYHLALGRSLGANPIPREGGARALRFALWAPNARAVEVVLGDGTNGYVSDDGAGSAPLPPLPLAPAGGGIWETRAGDPALLEYGRCEFTPYVFRVTRDDGSVSYRTDLYSRWQVGQGSFDPRGSIYGGTAAGLDGAVSCSAVVDPETVPAPRRGEEAFIGCADFWCDEYDPARPVPSRLEDLVIYELHVGALGVGRPDAGNLEDAEALLDAHLVPLGVNAVELLPMAEFSGDAAWGYGNSHHLAIEVTAGGRDALMRFVRACHRRGVAVIQDVVYNHWDLNAARAEWQVDSAAPERNLYYWYEGVPGEHSRPEGGYVNNGSSGWAPRYCEEQVRRLFASSAAMLVDEFHMDGFRVDLLDAIHRDNRLNEPGGAPVPRANVYGAKMLREWSRTLRLIRPSVMLVAEDHTGWAEVTRPLDEGGLGFDAAWYVDFFHHLAGPRAEGGWAALLAEAGYGDDRPLGIDRFDGALHGAADRKVVYHESHDEAGNSSGSARTIVLAVQGAPLAGATRDFAEARCRVVAGLSLLSPGTPMFLMGEEVGAANPYRHDDFLEHREDLLGLRRGLGARLFRWYQELIRLRLGRPALRSRRLTTVHRHEANRVIAFLRGDAELLVVASLANRPFAAGYLLESAGLPDAEWHAILNSDAAVYGGAGVGDGASPRRSSSGVLEVVLPACGLVVLEAR
ncbi:MULTISPECIES: alpha-amylase family glycosyl hydrolase [unclassified Anaeromyxobacter]|uniref:alpha-amylase family glycosyl hydrolase n=1 Tax=unclassified Anaeromyxobacter TaxID=2620896 RepID=UPI001F57DB62|nr:MULTISPECIES: alpha-amylase family glycosyl hydrolase [unclassified Anaeromyxobacter]